MTKQHLLIMAFGAGMAFDQVLALIARKLDEQVERFERNRSRM